MSATSPCPHTVRRPNRDSEQSAFVAKARPRQSANRCGTRSKTVRRPAAATDRPHSRSRRWLRLDANPGRPANIHCAALRCSCFHRPISQFQSERFHVMSSFDPAAVRKAVAEFTPSRPQKFQDLLPAKDVVVELRQKRASYRAIAELLTKHCLPTSKTAIAVFCHEVLGEIVRPRRRPGRKRPIVPTPLNGDGISTVAPRPTGAGSPDEARAKTSDSETPPARTRGPRIAQVRMLTPQNT